MLLYKLKSKVIRIKRPLISKLKDVAIKLLYERQREEPEVPYTFEQFKDILTGTSHKWVHEDYENVMLYLVDKNFIKYHIVRNPSYTQFIDVKAKLIDFYEKRLED